MAQQSTVPASEIEVKTELPQAKIGMAPATATPRKDLSGLRLKAPNAAAIYLVDPNGFLRAIPDPTTYNNLFRDWNGVISSLDIPNISQGPSLTSGAVLARGAGTGGVYLVTNGAKDWITSPAAMDKYYFNWSTVVQTPNVLVEFIPTGPSWS